MSAKGQLADIDYGRLLYRTKKTPGFLPVVFIWSATVVEGRTDVRFGSRSRHVRRAIKCLCHFTPAIATRKSGHWGGSLWPRNTSPVNRPAPIKYRTAQPLPQHMIKCSRSEHLGTTWRPFRPLLGWQRFLAPRRIRHRREWLSSLSLQIVSIGRCGSKFCQHSARCDYDDFGRARRVF
jgi:hypothetical protein